MRNIDSKYKTATSDPRIVFRENGRVINFDNNDRLQYIRVHVDGKAVKTGARCDFLLTSADEKQEHFIERKGKDLRHAIEQLEISIQRIGEPDPEARNSYIVSTNQAPALKATVQIAKKRFRDRYGSTLTVKEKRLDVKLP